MPGELARALTLELTAAAPAAVGLTPALVVDGAIIICALIALIIGWRQGLLAAGLSALGVLAGLIVGMGIAQWAMQLTDQVALRFLIILGVLIMFVGLGHLLGVSLGAQLRDRMRTRSLQQVDSAAGAVFQTLTALIVVFLMTIPLAPSLAGSVGQGLRNSTILSTMHRWAPAWFMSLPAGLAEMAGDTGLQRISPWQSYGADVEVDAPEVGIADQAMVDNARASLVHVVADAQSCSRRLMGSGFVTADDYVITNAHVVAGAQEVNLDTVLGLRSARVVFYDPQVDIAVLHSPKLELPPLPWATQPAVTGDDAITLGFPLSGPYRASPVRIRDRIIISGPNIYSEGTVERESYTLRGTIVQGNSGGPLVTLDGQVLGVIFGASVDDDDTGYALSAQEVQRTLAAAGGLENLRAPALTGSCVPH